MPEFAPIITLPGDTCDWTLYDLYKQVEMPIVPLIDAMQNNGMRINKSYMEGLHDHYQERMAYHQQAAAELVGLSPDSFNLGSPDQVADVLYGQLGLRAPKKTPSGKRGATDEKTIDELRDRVPEGSVADQFFDHLIGPRNDPGALGYRGYEKLDASYCDKALGLADENDRIYTTIKQTRVVSGRLSSAEPFNLMAIPQDGPEAKILRRGFVPRPGYTLMKWDYSQIDMRSCAHASRDPALCIAFILDLDVHTDTAARMFSLPIDQVDKDKHRYPAKRVNFGTMFGLTEQGLLPHLPPENRNLAFAKQFMDRYFEVYSHVKEYIEEVHTHARRYGWVADQFGRVRYIPEVYSQIERIRAEGLRAAFSHIIQGTAQGIIKIPMGLTLEVIEKYKLDCYPLIQIHDEVDVEIRTDQVREAAEIFGELYANSVKIDVPVKVEVEVGDNWGEMEKVLSVTSA